MRFLCFDRGDCLVMFSALGAGIARQARPRRRTLCCCARAHTILRPHEVAHVRLITSLPARSSTSGQSALRCGRPLLEQNRLAAAAHRACARSVAMAARVQVAYSESSRTKCIGLTIETRPDFCHPPHLKQMLAYGCTRIEMGVQARLPSCMHAQHARRQHMHAVAHTPLSRSCAQERAYSNNDWQPSHAQSRARCEHRGKEIAQQFCNLAAQIPCRARLHHGCRVSTRTWRATRTAATPLPPSRPRSGRARRRASRS